MTGYGMCQKKVHYKRMKGTPHCAPSKVRESGMWPSYLVSNATVPWEGLYSASCELSVVSCELSVASWFFLIFCELRVASCELRVASCELVFHHINSFYTFVLILDSSQSFS